MFLLVFQCSRNSFLFLKILVTATNRRIAVCNLITASSQESISREENCEFLCLCTSSRESLDRFSSREKFLLAMKLEQLIVMLLENIHPTCLHTHSRKALISQQFIRRMKKKQKYSEPELVPCYQGIHKAKFGV